jgi:anti-sigma B factor antagonist
MPFETHGGGPWTRVVPHEIQLGGEIDLANAKAIGDALCKALSRGQRPLVVDLADVTFVDSSAIAMMLHVHRHADALGVTVTWSNLRPEARRVIRITGVDEVLLVHNGEPRLPDARSV